jgi:hypothetical protein
VTRVLETQAPSAEPGLQNSILFSQKRDQNLSVLDEATHIRHDEPLKRSHARSLGDHVDPVVGHSGVSVFDPLVFMLASLSLIVATAAASYIPSRRVLRIDPSEALRPK